MNTSKKSSFFVGESFKSDQSGWWNHHSPRWKGKQHPFVKFDQTLTAPRKKFMSSSFTVALKVDMKNCMPNHWLINMMLKVPTKNTHLKFRNFTYRKRPYPWTCHRYCRIQAKQSIRENAGCEFPVFFGGRGDWIDGAKFWSGAWDWEMMYVCILYIFIFI